MEFKGILSRSGQSLLESRAANISNLVKFEQEEIINDLRKEILRKESELDSIQDLSINNTTSLNPVKADFKPSDFCKKIHEIKINTQNLIMEYIIAVNTFNDWFPTEEKSIPQNYYDIVNLNKPVSEK